MIRPPAIARRVANGIELVDRRICGHCGLALPEPMTGSATGVSVIAASARDVHRML